MTDRASIDRIRSDRTAIDRALELVGARVNGSAVRCPFHEDTHASGSVFQRDGVWHFRCHTCNWTGDALAVLQRGQKLSFADALDQLGGHGASGGRTQKPRESFKNEADVLRLLARQTGARHAGTWAYHHTDGREAFRVARFNLPAGGKTFRPYFRDEGGWHLGDPPGLLPIYNLQAIANAETVYVFEGEKCAALAAGLGLLATTSAHGARSANKTDWRPLGGKAVLILPDCGETGERYAAEVVACLGKLHTPPRSVKVVRLPGLSDGEDIQQFVEARDSRTNDDIRAELEALADAVAPIDLDNVIAASGPVLVRLSDVRPEPVRWLWPDRIALGKLTLIAGDPGLGKSFLALDLAARVSCGRGWPDDPLSSAPAGGCVLLSAEDDLADTIRPRLDAARADASKIECLQAVRTPDPETGGTRSVPFTLSSDLPTLEQAIQKTPDCRLVIIDPISAYLGGGIRFDSHRNTDVRAVLAPLAELAARRGVAVVAVTHLRKAEGPSMYRAMGSLAFVAAARAVWAVGRDKDDPARRLFLPVKCNLAGELTGLAFALRDSGGGVPCVAWEAGPIDTSADEALATPFTRTRGPEPEQQNRAAEWLRLALADGPRLARELVEEGREGEGLSKRTIERARQAIGVIAYRDTVPGPWSWRLPTQHRHDVPKPPEQKKLGDLGGVAEFAEKRGSSGSPDSDIPKTAKLPVLGNLGLENSPDAAPGCPVDEHVPDDVRFAHVPEADASDADEWGEI